MKSGQFYLMALVLATAVFARPRTTVKNTTVREENPKGSKNALVLPYAFSTDSMGFTMGVGGLLKGYWLTRPNLKNLLEICNKLTFF